MATVDTAHVFILDQSMHTVCSDFKYYTMVGLHGLAQKSILGPDYGCEDVDVGPNCVHIL